MTALSEAAWTAIASMVAAAVSATSLVLVALIRREGRDHRDQSIAATEQAARETIARLQLDIAEVNATLARHAVEELERYGTLVRLHLRDAGYHDGDGGDHEPDR